MSDKTLSLNELNNVTGGQEESPLSDVVFIPGIACPSCGSTNITNKVVLGHVINTCAACKKQF